MEELLIHFRFRLPRYEHDFYIQIFEVKVQHPFYRVSWKNIENNHVDVVSKYSYQDALSYVFHKIEKYRV